MKAELQFDTKRVSKPLISTIAIETNAYINILRADINEKGGKVLVEIPEDKAKEVFEALSREGVNVERKVLIEINNRCISCGHCITLCPVVAITHEPDLTVKVEESKCIQCGRCVDACPLRAIIFTR